MTIQLTRIGARPDPKTPLVPFRMREVGGEVLLTNAWGDWVFVSHDELASLARAQLDASSALHQRLAERNFLRDKVDVEKLVERASRKKAFLQTGPNLHIIVPTLRCNQTCVYCHASRADMSATDTDMTPETAAQVVEFIFQSTSPRLTIEFQGGEPLANFPIVQKVIELAIDTNRQRDKTLEFTLVTNLSLMDDEKLAWLVERKVQICTSLDGPAALHDKQRKLAGASAHEKAVYWIRRINAEYEKLGLDPVLYHVEALLTTTREALAHPQEIIDSYVELGCRAIFLRPVDPFGFARQTAATIEYERKAYLDFYRAALGRILELNRQGTQVLERYAAIFLTKILADEDPNYLDIRSPCGAGIGQLAYNYDGRIFTCDEGRMVHQMGDSFFALGKVGEVRYRQVVLSDTVRALTVASNLDAQPDCVNCTYSPYCGVCPVHNYATQGSIFGRMRESSLCAVYKGIQDTLFDLLRQNDPTTVDILKRWTTVRDRTHFIQACATP
ncbi:MAG: His-Xaa-Ser system radical SAM maturase HxsB [Deltaproteobacteria bacterium]|nr:His-Xaa-Ser system radical SAM maturase HxsB [Deltaproteobacteria bacterium]